MVSPVAVTTGEPAGIGPEVSVKAAFAADFPVTLIGDERFLRETAEKAGLPSAFPANVRFHNIPLAAPVVPGRLDVRNAPYVVETLKCACDGALAGTFSAVTTGPVQKSIISDSGLEFTGHTEFFAGRSRVKRVVMMLTSSEKADARKSSCRHHRGTFRRRDRHSRARPQRALRDFRPQNCGDGIKPPRRRIRAHGPRRD